MGQSGFRKTKAIGKRGSEAKKKHPAPPGIIVIPTVELADEAGNRAYYSVDGDKYSSPNVGFTIDGDCVSW